MHTVHMRADFDTNHTESITHFQKGSFLCGAENLFNPDQISSQDQ